MLGRKALERIEARQQKALDLLRTFEARQLETMNTLGTVEAGLIASDPRTSAASDAYNGLRKQVTVAAQERRRMLLQLVAMSTALERGATAEDLRDMCGQWCAEAGLARVDDAAAHPDMFELLDGEAPPGELVSPAWFDTAAGILIERGQAMGTAPEPESAPAPEPEPEPKTEPEPEPESREDHVERTTAEERE